MRRRRKFPFVVFALWLCIGMVGFLLGYYFSPTGNGKEPLHIGDAQQNTAIGIDKKEDSKESTTNEKEPAAERPVSSYEVIVGEETKVVFRTMYDKCKSSINEEKQPEAEMIGLEESEFKQYVTIHLQEWKVSKFSGDEVVLYQIKDQYCPNHFLVMDDGGYIAIYQYNEEGKTVLVEKTAIPTSNLPKVDQDRLKNGIPLPTREKVDQLLEDYIG